MAKEDLLEFTGTVTELLPNAMFRVKLDIQGKREFETEFLWPQ